MIRRSAFTPCSHSLTHSLTHSLICSIFPNARRDTAPSLTTATSEAAATHSDSSLGQMKKKSHEPAVECKPRFAVDLACLTGDKSVGPEKRLDVLLDADAIPIGT